MAFSPDGHRLASAGDITIRLWNPDTGQQIAKPFTVDSADLLVTRVAFSPDGHRLASAGARTIRLWDADTGHQIGTPLIGHTNLITGVAFSPDGHRIATGSADRTVRLWNADTGRPVTEPFNGHIDVVSNVSYSPDGRRIASASRDGTIRNLACCGHAEDAVRQSHHQHEPRRMAQMDFPRHSLHHAVPRTAHRTRSRARGSRGDRGEPLEVPEVTGQVAAPVPQSRVSAPLGSSGFDAFLSYTRRDRLVAAGIQRGLHLIGRRVGQLRALRVFRDDTNLEVSPDLWGKITAALDRARFLVVVLSPVAAQSHWVNKEVGYWLQHRGRENLLLVLAGGCLQWDGDHACFDAGVSDAAVPVLTQPGVLPVEPLFVDVSADAPWDVRSPVFRDKVTGLAAPIHGKPKDELSGEDVREQRRFRRLRRAAVAGLVVLTVLAVVAAGVAWVQRREAIAQRNAGDCGAVEHRGGVDVGGGQSRGG